MFKIIFLKEEGCQSSIDFNAFFLYEVTKLDLAFEIIEKNETPSNLIPKFFPYFFLLYNDEVVEEWGCVDKRKFLAVMKRNFK